jgi:Na+-transporting NADH:ubiquinone oxidoreductase subunit NqrD
MPDDLFVPGLIAFFVLGIVIGVVRRHNEKKADKPPIE